MKLILYYSAGELITGNHQVVIDELKAIRAKTNKTLKVILETGLLKDEALIIRAGEIAIECGADFFKKRLRVNIKLAQQKRQQLR